MDPLNDFKEKLAIRNFGKERAERRNTGRCIKCGTPFNMHPSLVMDGVPGATPEERRTPGMVYSDEGYREIKISGLCECCFDSICEE